MMALEVIPLFLAISIFCHSSLSYPTIYGTKRYGRSQAGHRLQTSNWAIPLQYNQYVRTQRLPMSYYDLYPYSQGYSDDYYFPQESYPMYYAPRTSKYEVYQAVLPYYFNDRPLMRPSYGYYGYGENSDPIVNIEEEMLKEAEREEREDSQPIGQEMFYENEQPTARNQDNFDDINAAFLQNLIMSQVYKDQLYKDSAYKDPMYKDLMYKEPLHKDPLHKDPLYKDPLHKDPLYKDPLHKDPLHKDPLHKDPLHKDPLNKDSLYKDQKFKDSKDQMGKDDFHKDALYKDAIKDQFHKDPVYKDALYREPMYKDSLYKDAMYKDVMYKDLMYKDALYTDPMYQDALYKDALYKDPMYKDVMYKDPMYKDQIYKDAIYKDPMYKDPMYKDPMYKDAMYKDPMYKDSMYHDSTFKDPMYKDSMYKDLIYRDPIYKDPMYINQAYPGYQLYEDQKQTDPYHEEAYGKWEEYELNKDNYREDEEVRELKQLTNARKQQARQTNKKEPTNKPTEDDRMNFFQNKNKNTKKENQRENFFNWDKRNVNDNEVKGQKIPNIYAQTFLAFSDRKAYTKPIMMSSTVAPSTEAPKRDTRGQKEEVMIRPATPVRHPFSDRVLNMMGKNDERKRTPSVYDTIKHMLDMEKSMEKNQKLDVKPAMRKRIISSEESLTQQLSVLKKSQ